MTPEAPGRGRMNAMARGRGLLRFGYWLYLVVGSLALLVVSLIDGQITPAVLCAVVLALAIWRLYVLRTDPEE